MVTPAPGSVSREAVASVVQRYADRVADLARRLGANADQARLVTERSAVALVEDAATRAGQLGDLGGHWFREVRGLVATLRAEGLTAAPPTRRKRATTPEDQLERALATLDERRMVALLLRDSYDLPVPAVAAGLGLSAADAATVVAEARLRLLEVLEGSPAPTLAGHPAVSGISFGALGRHADGSAGTEDPQHAARHRHVQTCQACTAFVEAQRQSRRAVSGLHVNALTDAQHEALVARVIELAALRLPRQVEVAAAERAAPTPGPSLRLVGALGVAASLVLGTALGLLTADRGSAATPSGGPTAGGPSIGEDVTGLLASASASPSASPSAGAAPSSAARTSAPPAAVRTSAPAPATSAPPAARSTAARSSAPAATSSAPVPVDLTLSPTSGPNDTAVTVEGTGFTPGATVTVTYVEAIGGLSGSTAQVTADARGSFSTTVVAHDRLGTPGPHQVRATDGSHSAQAGFTAT